MNPNQLPYRPQANFNAPTVATPQLPQAIDLNSVDPTYHDIVSEYNNNLNYLNTRLQNAQQVAKSTAKNVNDVYNTNVGQAENAYTGNLNTIQQANQDAQLANRLRARAIGGAPSSGFLDLANRTDIQSQKDIGQAGTTLQNSYQQANNIASQAYTNIQTALNDALAGIQSDATLSMRQKDDAMQNAKLRAAQLAGTINFDDILNSLSTTSDNQPTASVLGLDNYGIPANGIASGVNGGVIERPAPVLQSPTKPITLSLPTLQSPSRQKFIYGGSSK